MNMPVNFNNLGSSISNISNGIQQTIRTVKAKKQFEFNQIGAKVKINESVGRAAFYYEKLRNTIDYQDEHLFLKNAIKRILKRRAYFTSRGTGLALLKELVWAKYFENETLPESLAEEIESILRKYSFFRERATFPLSKTALTDIIAGFAACEIEELLSPSNDRKEYLKFCKQIISKNILLKSEDQFSIDIQSEIAIRKYIIKEDHEQIRFKLITRYYPDWPKVKKTEGETFAKGFASYYQMAEAQLKASKKSRVLKYVKRNSPPFNVIYGLIYKGTDNLERNMKNEDGFKALVRSEINRRRDNIRSRVLKAVVRGIIFILLTKIILAFLIEIPYERQIYGQINFTSLLTNITLPPVLMLIIGLLIKVPGRRNTEELVQLTSSVVFEGKLKSKILNSLSSSPSRKYLVFNAIYSIMSAGVLVGVIYLLILLKFNIASIILFYIFVSLVSFLGFRIRSIAKALEVRPEDDTMISGIYNFILLPFVVIGKFLSERWSEYNITLIFWDFVIEAPFKALIGLFESWLAFSREKREEFE